jgi:hypothetical protein
MIRDLLSSDPALNEAAWENLRGAIGLLESGDNARDAEPPSDARVSFRRAG